MGSDRRSTPMGAIFKCVRPQTKTRRCTKFHHNISKNFVVQVDQKKTDGPAQIGVKSDFESIGIYKDRSIASSSGQCIYMHKPNIAL